MAKALRLGRRLNYFGKSNRKPGAFADSVIILIDSSGGLSGPFQTVEQSFHAGAEQSLPECGIRARAGEILFRHGCEFAHAAAQNAVFAASARITAH
jgi:hypothetical protein